jgi:hypothetical protein
MPGMATIVVVQSDELAVWTGLIGALGGVALGAFIDWRRTRAAERRRTRAEVIRVGTEAFASAQEWQQANQAAGKAKDEAAWIEVIDARSAATRAALLTVNVIGNKELNTAMVELVADAMEPMPPVEDKPPTSSV